MSEPWARIPGGAHIDIFTRDGLAKHGVELPHEIMLTLSYASGELHGLHVLSIERLRELLPTLAPGRVRFCCAEHERAELRELAEALNAAARFSREMKRGVRATH